jgi:thiamine biosynthesis protein ThiI
LHYGELALKGKNRYFFEKTLLRNVKETLAGLPYGYLKRISGRFILKLADSSPIDEIAEKLKKVFGLSYFCPAYGSSQDLEKMKTDVWRLVSKTPIGGFQSFKIEAHRADKSFPFTSPNINEIIGEYVKNKSGAKVDLKNPELTVFVEIVEDFAFIYFEKTAGPGGLPFSVSGKIVSLISSGLDSPVASYRMMKRGCQAVFCHFHSYPMTSRASQENVLALCRILREYQPGELKIHFIPFLDIQKKILKEAPESLRVLLYRRQMFKIAEMVAKKEKALALATGESIGQVASQTLDNIFAVNEAVNLPVFRPLCGSDKEEIVKEARRIGTYDISIRPYDDCCSLFVPRHPETRAKLDEISKIERKLKLTGLLSKSLKQAVIKIL